MSRRGTPATADSFTYCANGTVTATTCSSGITATVTLGAATVADAGVTCTVSHDPTRRTMATYLASRPPVSWRVAQTAAKLPLTVDHLDVTAPTGMTVLADANGGFTAIAPGAGTYTFTFKAQNSQGTHELRPRP